MDLEAKQAAFQRDLLAWAKQGNVRSFPWRDPDATPYEVLVAEMLLSQTRTEVVADNLPPILERYPTVASLEDADREELVELLQPMGFYNQRADALLALPDHVPNGTIPNGITDLRELPRVGRYVAHTVACFAYDAQVPIVDRNVVRVYGRVFGDDAPTDPNKEAAWGFAEEMLPEGEARSWNMGLLDFASAVCKAPTPDCEVCFGTGYCGYYRDAVEG